MKIAYCTVVRDDEDVITNNIIYYYNLGIKDFYLLLHKATLALREAVNKAIALLPGSYFYITERDDDLHYHDVDMMKLVQYAKNEGCTWIVGTDADELLILKKHKTIKDFLSEYDHHQHISLLFKWFEYPPTIVSGAVHAPANVFNSFQYRRLDPQEQHKAIGKFDDQMKYVPGIHFISNAPVEIKIDPTIAFYGHFPDRNQKQFVKKIKIQYKNWMERYKSFPLKEQIDADPEFLNNFWHTKIVSNMDILVYDPINRGLFNA